MLGCRSVKTYAHRRRRTHAALEVESISGLDALPPNITNDDSYVVGSLRKTKERTYQQYRLSDDPDASDDLQCSDRNSSSSPEMPRQILMQQQQIIGDYMHQTHFETPHISFPKDPSARTSGSIMTASDDFSPVPVSRRILSRVGSRNLKENVSNSRSLASPFQSRPGSRVSSPRISARGLTKRARHHTKSRTLSSDMCNASQRPAEFVAAGDISSAPLQYKPQALNHNRTASIPALPSVSLDLLDPQNWLVPPKALPRSPSGLYTPNDAVIEHASFYFDVPAAASTPARHAHISNSIYTDDNLHPDEDTSSAGISCSMVPKAPGKKRRRTIMQAPEDSLFSSMLDFSAYVTDEESPNHIRRSRGPSTLRQELLHNCNVVPGPQSELGTAFCPSSVEETQKSQITAPSAIRGNHSPQSKALSSLLSSLGIQGKIVLLYSGQAVIYFNHRSRCSEYNARGASDDNVISTQGWPSQKAWRYNQSIGLCSSSGGDFCIRDLSGGRK